MRLFLTLKAYQFTKFIYDLRQFNRPHRLSMRKSQNAENSKTTNSTHNSFTRETVVPFTKLELKTELKDGITTISGHDFNFNKMRI